MDAPDFAYIPIPTVFKLNPSLLWALKRVFSDTGPYLISAMFSRRITLFLTFFMGNGLN